MIDGITNSGALEAMKRVMEFSSARQEIIAHNLANVSTPGFRPVDVSVASFQEQLGDAIDRRRAERAGRGSLAIESTAEVEVKSEGTGGLSLHPVPAGDNMLFHDGNDRSMEHILQDLVENFLAFRTASQLYRREIETLQMAIRERV